MRGLLAGLLALALALVASGCRGDATDEGEPTPSVAVTSTPSASPDTDTTPVPGEVTLEIASPRPDANVVSPVAVRYAVSGMELPAKLMVSVDASAPVEVELRAANGEVFVEGLPEGRWDVRFQLATADGTPVDGTGATVVVENVTITERGAGGGGLGY